MPISHIESNKITNLNLPIMWKPLNSISIYIKLNYSLKKTINNAYATLIFQNELGGGPKKQYKTTKQSNRRDFNITLTCLQTGHILLALICKPHGKTNKKHICLSVYVLLKNNYFSAIFAKADICLFNFIQVIKAANRWQQLRLQNDKWDNYGVRIRIWILRITPVKDNDLWHNVMLQNGPLFRILKWSNDWKLERRLVNGHSDSDE